MITVTRYNYTANYTKYKLLSNSLVLVTGQKRKRTLLFYTKVTGNEHASYSVIIILNIINIL